MVLQHQTQMAQANPGHAYSTLRHFTVFNVEDWALAAGLGDGRLVQIGGDLNLADVGDGQGNTSTGHANGDGTGNGTAGYREENLSDWWHML